MLFDISNAAVVIGFGKPGVDFYRLVIVLDGRVKIVLFAMSNAAVVVGSVKIGFEFYRLVIVLDGRVQLTLILCRKTSVKCLVSLVMDILYSDESMEVVVDSFGGNVVVLPQIVQHRLLEILGNNNLIVWCNETPGILHKYALLRFHAINRLRRFFDLITVRLLFQQDNPAIFVGKSVAGKEKGNEIVGREVD